MKTPSFRFLILAFQLFSFLAFIFISPISFAADNPADAAATTVSTDAELKQLTAHLVSQLTNTSYETSAPLIPTAPSNANTAGSVKDSPARTNTTQLVSSNNATTSSAPSVTSVVKLPDTTNTPAVLDDKHKLAIGDRLSYRILEDEEDPKPLTVSDLGDVEFPYIGRVPAENKTCKQLASDIKIALEKEYYYEATVIVAVDLMAKTRGRVYLVGALRMPGPQEILTDETLTLSKAILRCGGFADFANKKSVKITRKTGPAETDKQTFIVNVGQIYSDGKLEKDIPLEPGDMILVPDRKIRF